MISYSERKHLNLQLRYSDSKLQVKGKTVMYRNGFFEKSCKDLQTANNKKVRNWRTSRGNTNNCEENVKKKTC